MRELGWIEGQSFSMEARYADGYFDRIPKLADELLKLDPDVFLVSTTPANLAARAIRGTRKKIKILRRAPCGSNPGYPTGAGSSVNLRAGLAGTKNWRRQRMTCPVSSTRGRSTRPMDI